MEFLILMAIILIPSLIVSQRFKNKIKKYSKMDLYSGMSGKEIATKMLSDNGICDVKVVEGSGMLSDHYNPQTKTVSLSSNIYHGRSVASAAVAAHECGHAVQHATAYSMLQLRSALVPLQNMSGKIINTIFILSIIGGAVLYNAFPINAVLLIIIAAYSIMTLFAFITLPVEFDASKRAFNWLESTTITRSQELGYVQDGLRAAAMTYVVAALGSLATLLYYVSIFIGNRD